MSNNAENADSVRDTVRGSDCPRCGQPGILKNQVYPVGGRAKAVYVCRDSSHVYIHPLCPNSEEWEADLQMSAPVPISRDENERMKWLLRQVLDSLPKNRDWLDPAIEQEMRWRVGI